MQEDAVVLLIIWYIVVQIIWHTIGRGKRWSALVALHLNPGFVRLYFQQFSSN
jgi:hypothetical protein